MNAKNAYDILGSLMQQGGVRPSSGRLQDVLNKVSGPGGLGSLLGGNASAPASGGTGVGGGAGGLMDILGKLAGPMLSGGAAPTGQAGNSLPMDLIKTLGGAILSGATAKGTTGASGAPAVGAGALAMLGAIAVQALGAARGMTPHAQIADLQPAGAPNLGSKPNLDIDDASALIAGLRPPATPAEEQQVTDMASLTIRAMINAAKADGQIDEFESQRLLGKMQEDGVTDEERDFVVAELRKPMETDAIVREVPNQQAAVQIYIASLMAIQVDTDAERQYLSELASKLGITPQTVAYLHQATGLV
ncbi:hypothetical protein CKO25_14380 [Thiocapsa imhoffii]|uniref:Tellurite resistance TerB family protein n=1 Tax=Thiocapsa imhoffii TaxID=382777 RepID=A0A9X0WK40_9GAMM|nr:tellurite resistance TerB family protein [Thiocapsa imhoffii]MBK1645819.1 hypothetical protein [Thiocapsa imhoffii]